MKIVSRMISPACFALAAMSVRGCAPAQAQSADTGFFVTSTPIGNGGNLGGLAGADNQCQTLAQAAGAGAKTWRAYLYDPGRRRQAGHQRARPHRQGAVENSKGIVVAKDVAELHGANALTKQTALTERARSSTAAATRRTATTR